MQQVVRATSTNYQVQVTYKRQGHVQQQHYNAATLDDMWRIVNREKPKPHVIRIRVMAELACFDITTERPNGEA